MASERSWLAAAGIALALVVTGCQVPEPGLLPPNSFAFGVFGDGPYYAREMGRFRGVIEDANQHDLAWFLHVGDILWYPCSDEAYGGRLGAMNEIRHPVVYTAGDNEWADCWEPIAGGYDPLDRLAAIRTIFFANPTSSLGGRRMRLESQSADTAWSEFVENARWRRGGFVFATVHMVGGAGNPGAEFPGRTAANDREALRRAAAAVAWMAETFAIASDEGATGVVLAMHGAPGFDYDEGMRPSYEPFIAGLAAHAKAFGGPVLLIHGDDHEFKVDHPVGDPATGEPLRNLTRLETVGSPDIGWIRVVVDTVAGRFTEFEPRLMPRWMF